MAFEGMVNGRRRLENDFEHQRHEGGEKERTFVLFLGGVVEKPVELSGREESLENRADKFDEGGLLFEAMEDLIVGTHVDSFRVRQVGKTDAIGQKESYQI